jgi:hypothetical protein
MGWRRHHRERVDPPGADATADLHEDEGSVLILCLVFMIVGAMIVVPLMNYAMSVLRANTVLSDKTKRIESVKAGLRIALADPVSLYEQCGNGGPNTPIRLASPQVSGQSVTTNCYFVDFATAQSADEKHWGLVATQVGQVPPAQLKGSAYVPPNPANAAGWVADATTATTTNKIWLPNLPVHALNRRAAAGFQMPSGFATCKVFFPGTYTDPVTINGPTYFTSGIYYFENEVKFVGGASAVIGLGAEQGCSDDQEAAFYAVNAPATHNINGLGATFVFGGAGRLTVDNSVAGAIDVRFNQRYVQPGDDGAAPSQGVSIVSVNGKLTAGVAGPLDVPNVDYAPLSMVGGGTGAVAAAAPDYLPSTLTAETMVAPATTWTPIINVNLPNNLAANVSIPGYVSVPMGVVKVTNPTGKTVKMAGGVFAAQYVIADSRAGTPPVAQSVDIGFLESIVQRTFRIVSTNGLTKSTAIVQVNQNGAYAVNSWEVQ